MSKPNIYIIHDHLSLLKYEHLSKTNIKIKICITFLNTNNIRHVEMGYVLVD